VRDLPPNIFALVMATGIVSLACHGVDQLEVANAMGGGAWHVTALTLLGLNVIFYAVLWVLFLTRCLRHGDAVLADARTHARAPGYFTMAAATGVLGNQCVLLLGSWQAGLVLWIFTVTLWAALTYAVLPGLMESQAKPPLEKGLNGAWLLAVVATQSVCVLGCLIAPHCEQAREPLLFVALTFWLVGGMLYVWLIALIFYRVLFLPLAPADLTPPYWINMGAMAISTLGGTSLLRLDGTALPILAQVRPFVAGVTLAFWATATWWIPLLLALGAWRHVVQRYPLRYDHGYWAVVFPLGMYTVCTQNLVAGLELSFLAWLPRASVWLALGAWVATVAGLFTSLGRSLVAKPGGGG
jgi:tellurite resistance protein TehA-like permease